MVAGIGWANTDFPVGKNNGFNQNSNKYEKNYFFENDAPAMRPRSRK